ncbi:MAG TPA: ArsR family transcriptional regulator, partial [Gaiellaceae bacterium]|nr:ArsR family transcriptional regulator [Gaiellaceae bacterium]
MTGSRSANVTLPADDQILITREFDAPKHLVYKAYTTPELLRRWWHAKRGEVTVAEIDLRVGGKWRSAMVTPDGMEVAFNAVAEPRRRQILDALAGGERSVTELVDALGVAQPQVSKHLRVL